MKGCKIIYDKGIKSGLIEYGIEIPVSDSKSRKAFEFLADHPVLGRYVAKWHIKRIGSTISKKDLLRVHSKEYVDRLFSAALEGEIVKAYELIDDKGAPYRYNPLNAVLPLADLFKNRTLKRAAGTYMCAAVALKKGFCFFFGGGSHHAKRDYGEGFCLVNDIVVALKKLQAEKRIGRAWVIDVDAHKGDGTACLTYADDSIKTLSVHMAHGWPLDKPGCDAKGNPEPSFTPSDIDIGISKGEEEAYVPRLREGLRELDGAWKPDLALVVLGADPYEKDELASTADLGLSLSQMKERDLEIYRFLASRGIPQAHVMAGGYGESSWSVYAQFLEYVLLEQYGKKPASGL
jgi:acetoin utilization deacetylase AcuC-like enzyme